MISKQDIKYKLLVMIICNYEHHRGKIHYTEMYDMLKNIDPPLGFGNKCPNRLAYKKLIRMNMPVDQDGKVQFTTTLFALIRENLSIKMRCGEWALCIDIVCCCLCCCCCESVCLSNRMLRRCCRRWVNNINMYFCPQPKRWTRRTKNWERPSDTYGRYKPERF